jgi:hypothetical protein
LPLLSTWRNACKSASFPTAPASFPEIEFPSLRKGGVVLESEELRSSAIGQTGRDVGHASNLLDDDSSLIVIGGQKTLHFGSGAGDGAPGSFGKWDGITFFVFWGPVLAEEDIGRAGRPLGAPCFAKAWA